ncbi:tRNA (mnm(5)s(2)U34)-methyltransferase [Haploplasma axanthum]|uniref:Putative methyltransferase n=1 Tax=Haploplasma axanthum TaxID=29552 RepID=A0A449BEC4_HAPAX|nr:class I SAM-dependent methyltransferase [Haploplasma axanthum]VEU80778.1 putative methyltransferase [Haploplasma axanthum]
MQRNIVDLTHLLLLDYLNKDTIAIDMTLGNGFDTLFLAKKSKHVYSYDIQEKAFLNSKKLLDENKITNVTFLKESHNNIDKLNVDYQLVLFNLGYLPGSDKTITTLSETTIDAISKVLVKDSLKVLAIVIYRGHTEGQIEDLKIIDLLKSVNDSFKVTKLETLNTKKPSPYLILIEKK